MYTVIINGKISKHKGNDAEIIVRGLMSWYSHGTLFTVIDPQMNIRIFQKVKTENAIEGYSNLVDYIEVLRDGNNG